MTYASVDELRARMRAAQRKPVEVVVFPDKYVSGYPKKAEIDPRGALAKIEHVLTEPWTTDVHFVGYATDLKCRLTVGLFDAEHADKIAPANVRMTCAIFDVDDPITHSTGAPARPEWWEAEKAKLAKLAEVHPGFFVYRTRGGYRIVFALAQAHALRSRADESNWKALYLSWRRYLARRFDVAADRTCQDWTRHFRAPCVVRDGVRQQLETIGDASRLGVWQPELDPDDVVPAKTHATAHYGAVEAVPIADPTNIYGRARLRNAVEYLQTAPLSIKGQAGRNEMFRVCVVLVRRMRLPLDVAADLIELVYNPRLAAAGTDTWSRNTPGPHGMSILERLQKARDTGSTPPGSILDEATWARLHLGAVW